jgi:hypothetical protein
VRRGDPSGNPPKQYGFLSIGELLNVQGFDSTVYDRTTGAAAPLANVQDIPVLENGAGQGHGDFFKAVSLLATLDTDFLCTRSNTFTAYVTVTDRQKPQSSVRAQVTFDRSNLLPRLVYDANGKPIYQDPLHPFKPATLKNDGLPEAIGERQIGYFNARYDD